MGLFDLFRKKKKETTASGEERMWELWMEKKALSPYAELMTYQSEVGNGGHDQYFFNVSNAGGDLKKEMAALESVLSETLKDNLHKAYEAYLILEEKEEDEAAEKILSQCDDVLYENEQEINQALEKYAAQLT